MTASALPFSRKSFPLSRKSLRASLLALGLATTLGGCQTGDLGDSIASRPPPSMSDQVALRAYAETLEPKYAADPDNKMVAIHYAAALRGLTQHAQAVAVLQRLAVKNPRDMQVLAAYGKALADAGRLQEAANVLERAHTPDRPSWSVLSAQGSVADQLGDHAQAQAYYATALKIIPNQPDVLSNLGLSYALERKMPEAETALRQAAAQPSADLRVRQNLALVLSLEGKYADAEEISRHDLAPVDAAEAVANLKQQIASSDTWSRIGAAPATDKAAVKRRKVARSTPPDRVRTAATDVPQ